MTRTTTILIVVLAIVLIGGGTWYWFNRDTMSPGANTNTSTTNTTTNTTSNTNAALNANLTLPNEQKGEVAMNAKATIGGVELTFSSASKLDSFLGEPAPAGKVFIIAYFDGIDGNKVVTLKNALDLQNQLITDKGPVEQSGLKIASSIYKGDRGYLMYFAPKDAKTFEIHFGAGNSQTVKLPL